MSKTKGLIFDLDGTLTLTQQFHFLAYSEVLKKYGINYTEADDYRYAGQGSALIFPGIFGEHGIKLTPEQLKQSMDEKKVIYDRIVNENEIKVVPGVQEFLEKMAQKGLSMIVATGNKLDSSEIILKRTSLSKYFKKIITNKDVSKPKPAPDIFLKAAESMNLKPEECIVFEDAINGVQAAKAAGISCIAIATGLPKEKLLEAEATYAVKNYSEITDEILNT